MRPLSTTLGDSSGKQVPLSDYQQKQYYKDNFSDFAMFKLRIKPL